ncbi:MAG: NAD(P)H-hydrate dehydratase [Rhodoferax sp.]|nr:NAD(P)H-hydrate dehydratase [Rhodoferax sp.]
MATNSEEISQWVLGPRGLRSPASRYPLLGTQAVRTLERITQAQLPPHTLMERAGLALAQLALAYQPHANTIWIACGRGNNGGDGMHAARHLQQWGKSPKVSLVDGTKPLPADAADALHKAQQAGVGFVTSAPAQWELGIDALCGSGLRQAPRGAVAAHIQQLQAGTGRVVAADLPSGLAGDTGFAAGDCVRAHATLSFLALQPGLFTGHGRDVCGDVWLNTLGVESAVTADALLGAPGIAPARSHTSHKGSFGDLAVVGGASGMAGAALLAATAGLQGGAGRVFLALLDSSAQPAALTRQPALMCRTVPELAVENMGVVAGCGGGTAIVEYLPALIARAAYLVLDADALNALAAQPALRTLLAQRAANTTVLTPHPLEAARLLGCSTAEVQANRLDCAQTLAQSMLCTVILKGSGSVVATPNGVPWINTSGNPRLATGGTGDVLAGLVGAYLAQGLNSEDAAKLAVYQHGLAADQWPNHRSFSATALAENLTPNWP